MTAVADLAKPYPAHMIALVMGAPLEDAERLGTWANTIQGQFDPIKLQNELPALERAAEEFQAYARELLDARRGAAGDAGRGAPSGDAEDLLSTLPRRRRRVTG